MSFFGLLLGATVGAVVLVIWFKWHKRVTGGDPLGGGKPGKAPAEDLEAFIAAYRRGEASTAAPPAPAAAPVPKAAGMPAATAPPPAPAAVTPARREAFLSGAAKLVYFACRSGLRDHHCFANVRLQSLCTGKLDASLESVAIDLVVCDASLAIVAAIDIAGAAPLPSDAAKAECLRALGIRHLRLSPKALPKPEEFRNLLYRA